jgi:hypothetical protein
MPASSVSPESFKCNVVFDGIKEILKQVITQVERKNMKFPVCSTFGIDSISTMKEHQQKINGHNSLLLHISLV